MKRFNFHTHSIFCDGSAEPLEYVEQALINNFIAVGFSGHSPLPFDNQWSIKPIHFPNYINAIKLLKLKYADKIPVYLGLEIDYIPGILDDFKEFKEKNKLEYLIGSVHLVKNPEGLDLWSIDGPEENYISGLASIFKNDIKKAVKSYFQQVNEMITTQEFEVIGHFDKIRMNNKQRFFKEDDNWYIDLIDETLDIIKQNGKVVEINTRGLYKGKTNSFFPDINTIKKCYKLDIPVTISTDAHVPIEIPLLFDEAMSCIKEIGYKSVMMFEGKSWIEKDIEYFYQ